MKSPYTLTRLLIPAIAIYFLPTLLIFTFSEAQLSSFLILLLSGLALINVLTILASFSKRPKDNSLTLNTRFKSEKLLGLSILFILLSTVVYLIEWGLSYSLSEAFRDAQPELFIILMIAAFCLIYFIQLKFQPVNLSYNNGSLSISGHIPFLPLIKVHIPTKLLVVTLHEYDTLYTSRLANVYDIQKAELQLSYRNKNNQFKTLELPTGASVDNIEKFESIKSFLFDHKIKFSYSLEKYPSDQKLNKKAV